MARIQHPDRLRKKLTPAEALAKIYRYCAYQERSHQEVKNKLLEFRLSSDETDELLSRLITEGFVNERIRPLADRIYRSDAATASTGGRMVSSFADWVQAAHPFRHGQRTEVPIVLPDDLAILLISQGASFIRWLVDFDRQ